MKVSILGAVLLLTAMVGGCGGNSTAIGVTVSAAGVTTGATATVVANGTLQYSSTVSGGTTTTVSWAICLPATTTTTEPSNCTAPLGPTGCALPAISGSALSGHGIITQTGLYTAPPTAPSPNKFVVMASSCVNPKSFGILNTQIDSGARIQLVPATATLALSEHYQFTATVTGTSNTGVSWSVNNIAGGNATVGYICPNPAAPCTATGEYFAPATAPGNITITATSAADSSKTATATVTVGSATDPTLTRLDPATAAQGSVEQDVYLIGANFRSTSTVLVAPPGQNPTPVATNFLSSTLLRATIPGVLLGTAGPLPIEVQAQNGGLNIPGPVDLTLVPMRPALIASSPDSVSQNSAGATVNLTGGFFSPGTTTVQFDGSSSAGVSTTVTNSRQLSVGIPAGNLTTPGLYPIVVQNAGLPTGQPATAALNLAVTPTPGSIATAPTSTVGVGPNPTAIGVDRASAIAVVANAGDGTTNGTVSVLNFATNPPSLAATVTVGKKPTGVAVDDLLSPHVALVVNSGDQTVSTINLVTDQVVGAPLSVAIGPPAGSPAGSAPVPYAIGINPITHRAVVAYQSFNEATILDVSTGTPAVVEQVGGDVTAPLGTGPNPAVAIDPALNWAVIAPGGGGIVTTNIVDLGRNPTAGDSGRAPEVIGSIALAATGIGINSETHQAFLANSSSGTFNSFSLLDNTVNTISFTNNGVPLSQTGYLAAAADPLENIGIAVNQNSPAAAIVDLKNGNVLQNVALVGSAIAVAIDPASNQAFVLSPGAPGGNGSLSTVSLGAAISPLQIVESSPGITFTSPTAAVTLTITGSGFVSGSQVVLDGTPLAPASVLPNGRQIVVSVPASMVSSARRYAVEVVNPGGAVSNVTGLSVIQPVTVGRSPVGVAVDTDRDLAVITNSGSGTVSLVALSPSTPVGTNQLPAGTIGLVGQPIPVGTDPLGVAVLPRLGLALVANNGSNNVSLIDVTQTNAPLTVSGCTTGGICSGQMGVAIDQDTAVGVITNSTSNNYIPNNASNSVSFAAITAATSTAAATVAVSATPAVDLDPTAVAIDPVINPVNPALGYAAVTTASQASSLQLLSVPSGALVQRVGSSLLQVPTGIVFDPVNQVFLVANSLMNNVAIIDPGTLNQSTVRVGINPTSLDYNFQASTLVTVNGASHTMSILDYACPPPASGVTTACPNPQVRAVLGLGGSQQFSVAIDPRLNLAVVADQNNNRILLVPLPF